MRKLITLVLVQISFGVCYAQTMYAPPTATPEPQVEDDYLFFYPSEMEPIEDPVLEDPDVAPPVDGFPPLEEIPPTDEMPTTEDFYGPQPPEGPEPPIGPEESLGPEPPTGPEEATGPDVE